MGLDQSTTAMEYSRVKIGQSEFLLPLSSELAMTHLNGDENRNRIHFSGCRQYSGESVLSFGEAPMDAPIAAVAKKKENVNIPANARLEVALDSDVDSEHSMVGDAIVATLRQDIKVAHRTLFAKGATLAGRILRLERHSDHYVVDLLFSAVDSPDTHSTVTARVEVSPFDIGGVSRNYLPRDPSHSDPGLLSMFGSRLHLPKGFHLRLRTFAVPASGLALSSPQ
jgi:hypothetical protein